MISLPRGTLAHPFRDREGLVSHSSASCAKDKPTYFDSANDVYVLELASANTQWAASEEGQNAFATLLTANLWMIFRNVITGVLHWDYASLHI